MKIAAVVVTFNRKDMLLETLSALKKQTKSIDRIYLINNASTDGTHDLLSSTGLLEDHLIEYHLLNENTGGAGGFSFGVQLAYDAGFDWIWTMDDDVEAKENALEVLLSYAPISKCMNSTKIFTENNEVQYWEQYFDFATCRLIDLKNSSFATGKDWCFTNVACFEGMLIHKDIVEKIGPPDASYFIYHDDTVYGIKASLYTNVIFVRNAIFYKKIYGYGASTPLRAEFHIRNLFKLRNDIFATGLLGEKNIFTTALFVMTLIKDSIKLLKENPSLKVLKSLAKSWYRSIKT